MANPSNAGVPDDALRRSPNTSYAPNSPTPQLSNSPTKTQNPKSKIQNPKSKTITINQPPEYEHKLLMALACFLNRPIETQANAALCMYLRQGQDRIMSQVRYYAHKAGMGEYELLDKIAEDPDWVQQHVVQGNPIHPTDEADVFT